MATLRKTLKDYENSLEDYSLDVGKPWLLTYWSDALGVPLDTLREAIAAVGTNVNALDEYLAREKLSSALEPMKQGCTARAAPAGD